MMGGVPVVAIDGPVGVGKSSVARRVADRLGFVFLDTGAMYRAVAWTWLQVPESARGGLEINVIAKKMQIELEADGRVIADGRDVSREIRAEEVSRSVHLAADNREVREALVEKQRAFVGTHSSVMEGRDIGTVVFPDARWKFYLDAAADVRTQRRAAQLEGMGMAADRVQIRRNLVERDARDRGREWGALQIAGDATVLDTTELSEDRVVELICAIVSQ